MTPAEAINLFYFDPSTPRMTGYGVNASIVRDVGATAISACVELLNRPELTPSGKFLWVQLQPSDALALAAAILVHAKEEGWPINPDLLNHVERISLAGKKN